MTRPIKTPLALPVAMLVYVIMLIILTGRLVVSLESVLGLVLRILMPM